MPQPRTFRDIIGLWPSAAQMARDLATLERTVRKWRDRGSIPPEHYPAIIKAAQRRGFGAVTLELLHAIYTRRWAA